MGKGVSGAIGEEEQEKRHVAPHFEEEKFQALDRFLRQLKTNPHPQALTPFVLEEWEISFLEHCDEVLLDVISRCFGKEWLQQLHDPQLRENLIQQVVLFQDTVDPELSEKSRVSAALEDSLDLIEQLEDVSESWLTVLFLEKHRLKGLYRILQRLQRSASPSKLSVNALRATLFDLVKDSPLFVGEEALRFCLMFEYLELPMMLPLLNHFLQGQLEYGRYLQSECLRQHPELLKKIKAGLWKEAACMARKLTGSL
ncbi:MAG: hypothetical protein ACD_28C00187G0002 [uncultured bacterium]|nr:MAG: hypothetical protein ACD_28C00187G0002 [uncultured bacterium]